jgi:hypothetical protein
MTVAVDRAHLLCALWYDGGMTIGGVLITAVVATLSFLVLFALDGWVSPRGFGGNRRLLVTHRLPYRFSLRSLIIATTLIAVLLGAIVYALR